MKKIKLLKSDYIAILLVGIFVIWILYKNGNDAFIGLTSALVMCLVIVIGGRAAYRRLQAAENNGSVDKLFEVLKEKIILLMFFAIPASLAVLGLWLGYKILLSAIEWLRLGFWYFYDYQAACTFLGFSCFPSSGFVKIDEFLRWVYNFDITVFLIATVLLSTLFLYFLLNTDNNLENRN